MSVNKVMLLGRLGGDPELRHTQSQTPVTSMSLATNDRRKGQDGEWTDFTEWHKIVVFGKQAENCAQYLKKGRQAFIEGRVQTRKWQDKEGKDRYTTEIVANSVQFIGGRGDSEGAPAPANSSGNFQQQAAASATPASTGGIESVPFDDDDIPF